MTETTWPAKPKIFTVWLFIGKTCRLLSSKAQPGSWALAKREEARNQCPQVSDGGSGSHLSTGWASRGSATPETLGAGRMLQGGSGTQRREETFPCVLETQHPVKQEEKVIPLNRHSVHIGKKPAFLLLEPLYSLCKPSRQAQQPAFPALQPIEGTD